MKVITFLRVFLLVICMMITTGTSFAIQQNHEMDANATAKQLQRLEGTWYDSNGNAVLTISNGYINGCPVVKGLNFVGGYPGAGIFRIVENDGYRDIRLSWSGQELHKTLILDKEKTLYHTNKPSYYESVGGIYLGMNERDVVNLYGVPTQKSIRNGINEVYQQWIYPNLGLKLALEGDAVVSITMTRNGNRHFDRSGLNCNDTLQAFYAAYGLNRMPKVPTGTYTSMGMYDIGHGEYLNFDKYPDEIMLSIYSF